MSWERFPTLQHARSFVPTSFGESLLEAKVISNTNAGDYATCAKTPSSQKDRPPSLDLAGRAGPDRGGMATQAVFGPGTTR